MAVRSSVKRGSGVVVLGLVCGDPGSLSDRCATKLGRQHDGAGGRGSEHVCETALARDLFLRLDPGSVVRLGSEGLREASPAARGKGTKHVTSITGLTSSSPSVASARAPFAYPPLVPGLPSITLMRRSEEAASDHSKEYPTVRRLSPFVQRVSEGN
jgi:hypothetical protein